MGKLKDKLVGETKQVVAELTGDGKLAEEGRQQIKNRGKQAEAAYYGGKAHCTEGHAPVDR